MDNNSSSLPKIPSMVKKKKGPFRKGLLFLLLILGLLNFLYFHFFFDRNLKSSLEFLIENFHGAEVNIGTLRTSFTDLSLSVGNIEITDKENPKENILSIGSVKMKFLWDALLRGKFLIEDSNIEEIALYSPRKREGKVFPKKEEDFIERHKVLKKGKEETLKTLKENFSENVLGDIASLLDGSSLKGQVGEIKEELAVERKIKELEKLFDQKEEQWKERIKNLPKEGEFKDLIKDIKETKLDKNPLKAAKKIKELEKKIKEGKKKVQQYKDALVEFNKDIKRARSEYEGVDDLIAEDIRTLEKRFKIPQIDGKSLSVTLFSRLIGEHEKSIRKYMALVEEYLPNKEQVAQNKKEEVRPRERGEGEVIDFPLRKGYPAFWLKKAVISSKATEEGFSGNVRGGLRDFTSSPSLIKKPALFELNGYFPRQEIEGLNILFRLNHHQKKATESLMFKIARLPVKSLKISGSKKMGIILRRANLNFVLDALHFDRGVRISLINKFTESTFEVHSKSKKKAKYLQEILNEVKDISLKLNGMGNFQKMNWKVSSNLGHKLSRALKKKMKQKIEGLRSKIKKSVEEKIGKKREKLGERVKKIESEFKGKLEKNKSKVDEKMKELSRNYKEKMKKKSKKSVNKAKKKLKKKLKKLFKF